MIRASFLALSTCLATVPGLARAQSQVAVLQEVTRICSDPAIMPGDWDAALVGWQRLDPPQDMIPRLVADKTLQYAAIEGQLSSDLPPADRRARMAALSADMQEDIAEAGFGSYEDDRLFYDHPSGWFLMLRYDRDDPVHSECRLSHASPDADLIAELERPYMTVAPFETFLGRGILIDGYVPENTGETANVEFLAFVLDAQDYSSDLPPEADPVRLGSAVGLNIFLSAFGREGAT